MELSPPHWSVPAAGTELVQTRNAVGHLIIRRSLHNKELPSSQSQQCHCGETLWGRCVKPFWFHGGRKACFKNSKLRQGRYFCSSNSCIQALINPHVDTVFVKITNINRCFLLSRQEWQKKNQEDYKSSLFKELIYSAIL